MGVTFFLQLAYLKQLGKAVRCIRSATVSVKKQRCGCTGLSLEGDSVPVVPFFLMQGITIPALLRMTSSFIRVKLDPIAMPMSKLGGELEGK